MTEKNRKVNVWKKRAANTIVTMMVITNLFLPVPISAAGKEAKSERIPVVIHERNRSMIAPSHKNVTYTYRSSNENRAKVSRNGVITARKKGKVSIVRYCTRNGKTRIDKVGQFQVVAFAIKGKNVIYKGGKYQYKTNAGKAQWSSNNKKIATISRKGNLVIKKTGTIQLTAKCGSNTAKKTIVIKKDALKRITAVYQGEELYEGQEVNRAKLKVMAINYSKKKKQVLDFQLGSNKFEEAGQKELLVTYKKCSAKVKISVKKNKAATLKASYTGKAVSVGKTISTNDIKAVLVYNDGSERIVSAQELALTNATAKEKGKLEVVVIHSESGLRTTVDVPVTALSIAGVEMKYSDAIVYTDEKITAGKISITVTYEDGSKRIVDPSNIRIEKVEYEEKTAKIHLRYTVDDQEYAGILSIAVKNRKLKELKVSAEHPVAYTGKNLNREQFSVRACYSDGSEKMITDWVSDYIVVNTPGERNVRIQYTENDITVFQTIKVQVIQPELKIVKLTATNPTGVTLKGGELNQTGMAVSAEYDDGSKRVVSGWSTNYSKDMQPGDHAITVSYKGATAIVQIRVEEALQIGQNMQNTLVKHPVSINSNHADVTYAIVEGNGQLNTTSGNVCNAWALQAGTIKVQISRKVTGEVKEVIFSAEDYAMKYQNLAGGNAAVGDRLAFQTNAPTTFSYSMVLESGQVYTGTVDADNGQYNHTAKNLGTLTVTATDRTSGIVQKKTVRIHKALEISGPGTVKVGKKITLSTTKQQVKWSSSKPNKATVSASGVVKGVKKGTTTITATFPEYGDRKVTKKITITS